jgi:hypothetical protein
MTRFVPRAVDFQVAEHDVRLAVDSRVNEGIGHKHAHGVEHVRAMLTVGYHQEILALHGLGLVSKDFFDSARKNKIDSLPNRRPSTSRRPETAQRLAISFPLIVIVEIPATPG